MINFGSYDMYIYYKFKSRYLVKNVSTNNLKNVFVKSYISSNFLYKFPGYYFSNLFWLIFPIVHE